MFEGQFTKKANSLIGGGSKKTAADHPSQYDAEFVLDLSEGMDMGFGSGTISPELKAKYEKMDKLRMEMWQTVFGDKSPWSVTVKGKKRKVVWDKAKAERLGV